MIHETDSSKIILTKDIRIEKINFNKPESMEISRKIFKSTRYEEVALSNWPPEQAEFFLNQQFDFQHIDYTSKYLNARFYFILYKKEICGRLYIDYREKETRIIDIALLPEYRNKKIGSTILNILKSEADKLDRPLSLHVENFNRARTLYQRHGFKEISNDGVYILMEYQTN